MENKTSEELLIRLLRDKSTTKEGVAFLIKNYQMPLYWHIRKLIISHDDSKDVLQEVFLRVWRSVHQFKGESKISTWLYRIATNESLRFLEKKQRRLSGKTSITEILSRELETSPYISGEEIQITLQKAVLTLTDRQRLVFNMRYFDEFEYDEMAKILKTTVNNVKVLYHNAKKQIEENIKEEI